MATNADKPGGGMKRVRRAAQRPAAVEPAEEAVVVRPEPVATTVSIRPRPASTGSVRNADITAFLRQLIMMIDAGTPLLRSLKTLSERGEKASVRALIADMTDYVEMGNPLWQAFERHPRHFDTVFVNLIKASEASGTLAPVVQRIVQYRERRELLRKRVRGAMFYPFILVFACFAVVMFIAMVVVPQFEDFFAKFDVQVPTLSRIFMGAANAVALFWWLPVLIVIGLVIVYKLWYVQNPLRRITADRIKLGIPIIGPILIKNSIVEFSRTLSLLLKSGLSMMSTLELVRNAIHNRAFAQTLQSMRDSVERGGGLEQPLREASAIIPPVVTDMLVTGEESGRLDIIAEQIANTYEEEVNISIATLGEAL
ncbi:MAG: type II secretion system F family protein, partial [Candidatus Hydrogenedentes bacterium]|nr:type II secretion system F family protein [Candidatus Hydrogenedentota bacterium]